MHRNGMILIFVYEIIMTYLKMSGFFGFIHQNILNGRRIGDKNIMFIIVLPLINVIGLLSYNYLRIPVVYDVFNSVMRH